MTQPSILMLIVAAGRGLRAGGGVPKQYRPLRGAPVLTRTIEAMARAAQAAAIGIVIHPDDEALCEAALGRLDAETRARIRFIAEGGATRSASVRNGLAAWGEAPDDAIVLIHDAARPFVSAALVARALQAMERHAAAVPSMPVTDTVKRISENGLVIETLDRAALRTVQTPQAFRLGLIRAAHEAARTHGRDDFTDDGALIEWTGAPLGSFDGEASNVKLTVEEDFARAESASPPMTIRVATGYDVHAFGPGDHVWICGVRIAHDQGVVAHSDGDVALHALCDAIFGVLGDGDIGVHFPPNDERWRGASSDRFLAFACERLRARSGEIDHLDLSIVCERPKIGPSRDAMRRRIAEIAGVRLDQVGLKATTSERLGFTGRQEGLAALATVTVRLPAGGPDDGR
jgi:2-C-methyl-D-erythritol 4-phosphate cytidylyltransferase/2-C-methyl-D-erythritol 2,4-cyclodiphosphate synthase